MTNEKTKTRNVRIVPDARTKQVPDDIDSEEWDHLDTIDSTEPIRKSERPQSRKAVKQAKRREQEREWGREFHRIKRERRRSPNPKP